LTGSRPSGTISSGQKKSGITKGFFRVFHFFEEGSERHFKGACRDLNDLEKGDGCPEPENVVQRPLRGRKREARLMLPRDTLCGGGML